MDQVQVSVYATDAVSHAGLVALLAQRPEVTVLAPDERARTEVLVVQVDRLNPRTITLLRTFADEIGAPVVLITGGITETELLTAVSCRVVAVLPRHTVASDKLVGGVLTAHAGGGVMSPPLVGELLKHIERVQREVLWPHGLSASGLLPREVDVLKLMADGLDTVEIAEKLAYSERSVKNIIYGLTQRLGLRNRPHAVAYALRAGII
ncbi:helix-turn-helix transcriptional regulator [Catenuloplanes japonicus]|uniref:helix-turn-helix transcriptional regulator n=1 Tax=Catenuloplanes japonicus TaxID=33876 RepID=UPI0005274383|nr:LuxR C-terminal-related transcriptional regulator [Catenuloplanes japonicus]